jgi:translocation and assembly module TamB
VKSNNLHELESIADMFQTPTNGQPPQPLNLQGTAEFTGAVRGNTSAPQVTGQLTANNVQVKGTSWRLLRSDVSVGPSLVSLQRGLLQPADKGQITFDVRAGLRQWSFTQTSPFQVALNAQQINVTDFTKAAGVQTNITGTLNANVAVSGSELNPVGQGQVALLSAKIGPEALDRAQLNFRGTGNQVAGNLLVRMRAGTANGTFTIFPKQQAYDAHLRALGVKLEQLQSLAQRNLQLKGVLNLTANGRGTFQNPGVQALIAVPKLQIENQTINGLTLQAAVANHVGTFALDSQLLNTYARARGTINLTGNYNANATLDTQAIPLGPLVAVYAPTQAGNITGQTEIHATLRGPLGDMAQLDAHITVPQLALNYKNSVHLAAASPIHVDYTGGVVTLQRAAIRGTDTDLQFQGRIPMQSSAPASLLLLGNINLQLAQLFNPDIVSSGQLRFNINSYGQRANPNIQGQVEVVNANFASGDVPIGLQNGNGVLTLTRDRLDITSFTGTIGGGSVAASGGVVYKPSVQFDLGLKANDVRMLYPQGVRTAVSTNVALTGTMEQSLLRGQIRVTNLAFTPDFDLTNFLGQFSSTSTPPPAQGFSTNLGLDLGVITTTGINLSSRQLSLAGTANLHVIGTAAQPVVLGRVNINGGDIIFTGNRYVLQGGTIQFINPNQTQPVMDVSATTTIQQYDILLHFWGPSDHLHTSYSSDPALPPADIINLVAFGKTSEASAANPTPPGALGAESLIASQVSSQVTNRFEKIAGISQLSVDPELGGNGKNPGARISIQQRVTSKMYVTFGTDVTSTQNESISLEYKFTPRKSVTIVRDQNGGLAFDTRFRKSW